MEFGTWSDWLIGFLAAAGGACGLGGGGILLLYLTAFQNVEQLQAQGTNLLFFLPVAAAAVILHGKKGFIRWRAAGVTIAAGLPGVCLGWALAGALPTETLRTAFAIFLVLLGGKELFAKSQPQEDANKEKTDSRKYKKGAPG